MTTRLGTEPNTATYPATSFHGDEHWRIVQRILTSPVFARSPRMRALLSFLMLRTLSGMEGTIDEWSIGIEVFRRDAGSYDPVLDPVVRVQTDRLRERLAQHYALYEPASPWQVTIPGGELVPVIVREDGDRTARRVTIELTPVPAPVYRAGRRSRTGRSRARAWWPELAPCRALAASGRTDS